ncbi:MAG: PilT/PilU family type 4a pilus ATPase [Candidatus Harrisonbacteria bacterium]|nr:PilT/PilU family type 4a pilus ATPase [Candidatus Harrisonbacteria bacterium]
MDYKDYLARLMVKASQPNVSDFHFNVGLKPHVREDGFLQPIPEEPVVTPEIAENFVAALLTPDQQARFQKNLEIDFSYTHDKTRFRVNVYYERGFVAAAFRHIPEKIMTIEDMEMPPVLHNFSKLNQGFILAVGPAGHGKSATLAALLDEINASRREHIITIEDPIEHIFVPKNSLISQREVYSDTQDFHAALKTVLRQDPDVVMIGEMRDLESVSTALTAAETGHLVFSTLHTNSAAQTIDRIIDSFPPEKQNQAIIQLAATLAGIVSKRLIPKIGGGRVAAAEILIVNTAVRNLIRERKTHQLDLVIETSLASGMISLNRSLAQLVKAKKITRENAELYSLNPAELRVLIGKV